nr:TonB-dependent receptor [uncultured Duganella sp.]
MMLSQSRLARPTRLAAALSIALSGYAATSLAARAQTPARPPSSDPAGAAVKTYAIGPGTLASVLERFGRSAGVNLAFEPAQLDGVRSEGVNGNLGVEAALQAVLRDTGLEAVARGDGYALRRAAPPAAAAAPPPRATVLPEVVVTGALNGEDDAYRARRVRLGALGAGDLRDTPYSVEVVTRELIENKQAHSLVDAVKGDAGVASGSNYVAGTGDVLLIRGVLLSYRNNYKLDGMDLIGFLGAPQLPVEVMENIEVLKGAGGFLYGFGTPGGIVNLSLKRPTDTPVLSLATQVTDDGKVLVHGDAGGRFGDDGRFGYRVNLVEEKGDTYVKDGGKVDRQTAAASFDWRVTPDLLWSVDGLHQERRVDAVYYQLVPNATGERDNAIAAPPPAVDGGKRLASPFTYSQVRSTSFGSSLSWQLAPAWNASVSYRKWDQDMFSDHSFLYANAAGRYTEMQISLPSRVRSEQTQAVLSGGAATGAVRHTLTLGASYSDIRAQESNDFKSSIVGAGTLGTPTHFADPQLRTGWTEGGWNFPERQKSLFASDVMRIGSQVDVIAGVRRGTFKSTSYDKSATTPTLALVYRPVAAVSTYASYVEALEQGAVAPTGTVNAGQVFAPLKSKQLELGVKAEGKAWSASAALFRMNQGLSYITAEGRYTQDGEARYQGLELSSKLRLDRRWNILASAVLLDAKNTKTSFGLLDGKRTAGASRQQYAVYSEYTPAMLPATLTGGVRYVGARALDTGNAWQLPGYTVWDIGARHVTSIGNVRTTLRVNIDNLGAKAYWLMAGSNRLIQGAPRTVNLGAQFEF